MNTPPSNLVLFLGHFHPLLVHLPIGGLILLGLLELLARFRRWNQAALNRRWILGINCVNALAAAACGWLLARSGGYDPQLLKWHQFAGLGVAAAALVAFLCLLKGWLRTYRTTLALTLGLLVVAGHLGGSMSHGRDFLTRYAPLPWRGRAGSSLAPGSPAAPPALFGQEQPVFAAVIEPILQRRCVACHGAEKHKGDLRLDTLEGIWHGGQDGAVIQAGQAGKSPLIQCLLSPQDADGHMPPEEQAQPTPEEIALLAAWVNAGAPAVKPANELEQEPPLHRFLPIVGKSAAATQPQTPK